MASPLLTWITIVSVVIYQGFAVFGTAAQSNLLMISSQQTGTNIPSAASLGSALSILLLLAGGIIMLSNARLGVPISLAGLLAYVFPMYQVFGSETSGFEQTFISPGIGVFVAGTGVALGVVSYFMKSSPLVSLLQGLKTSGGLAKLGVFVASVGLTLDVLNHAALGQLPDFIGLTAEQQALHLGLTLGVASMFVAIVLGSRLHRSTNFWRLSLAILVLLGVDSIYALTTGDIHDFLGHNLTETFLHFSVYYGTALVFIGGLVGSARTD